MAIYRRHRYQFNATIIATLVTMLLIAILIFTTQLRPYVVWLISLSITTFALFGVDKALSRSTRARIPESILHLFTLLGGFPGQFIGRLVFHHKTNFKQHPSFTIVLIISIVLQALLVFVFFI